MKAAVIVMTLLACDCDGMQCNYLRTVSSGWASLEACQADIEKQLTANASYPLLTAQCNTKKQETLAALNDVDEHAPPTVEAPAHSGRQGLGNADLVLRRFRGRFNARFSLLSRFVDASGFNLIASDRISPAGFNP